jgi:hypothetical protein
MTTTTTALPSFLIMLADDIGWGDFSYNNGTALTPNIDTWSKAQGSVLLQDFHSGGTTCSPTRATVLTGRHHFRDCVDYVYGCSDMRSCPKLDFEFAPSNTFTVGDAVRSSAYPDEYDSVGGAYFAGKWHLGSFFNDSNIYGGVPCGVPSSPITHGFTKMNATIEVAPTATTNCQCKAEWMDSCDFGHYNQSNHCYPEGECCFNYWWDDPLGTYRMISYLLFLIYEHNNSNICCFSIKYDNDYIFSYLCRLFRLFYESSTWCNKLNMANTTR